MFPIRDDNPHILTPYATILIIALNAAAWVLVQGMGAEPALSGSVCRLGLIPGELLHTVAPGTEFPIGPQSVCVIGAGSGWYTTVTSMFLHGGWFHIIGNMWFLWIFGNNVEDSMGHLRFLVFYLLCGLAAAATQVASNPGSPIPMVGASGAIGGVMGAYILLYPRVHVHLLIFLGFFITTVAVPAVFMLGYWFLLQVLSGVSSIGAQGGGVAFWAHAGGFLAGAVLVLLFRDPRLLQRHPYHGWRRRDSATQSWRRIGRR
ncbi:MAG: rhomboid family intramembrane serine protease [Gammaproteobacteria bacterium]|nr:rhomboid family intramembrane serine protease [Gammaproteobacteria bacterium]MDH4253571.1 rhomboid family intramembrane serine protease [Gammaproteobacteria bacterium]MDH5310156.1 rhomboid family intramembrane serine protease [Gammaproteobacteria bacterium]